MTEEEKNAKLEELCLDGDTYFNEDRRVKSTRKSKTCNICGGNIPVGSGHLIFKMYRDEYYDFNICNSCEENEVELISYIKVLG